MVDTLRWVRGNGVFGILQIEYSPFAGYFAIRGSWMAKQCTGLGGRSRERTV